MRTLMSSTLLLLAALGAGISAAEPERAVRIEVAEDGTIRASFRQDDLRDVLRAFAGVGKFQLVLHESVRGRVDAEFDGVAWADALRAILRSHGLAAAIDGRLWWEGSPGERPRVARIYAHE